MHELGKWRLCDGYTVIQAALLICGEDPGRWEETVLGLQMDERPRDFDASFAALKYAVQTGRLRARVRHEAWEKGWSEQPVPDSCEGKTREGYEIIYWHEPDWNMTLVGFSDVQEWLRSRGVQSGFFFDSPSADQPYLNPNDPMYTLEFAALYLAAQLLRAEPDRLRGKSPKMAAESALREVERRIRPPGTPRWSSEKIKVFASVLNWDRKGGAPKTPGGETRS